MGARGANLPKKVHLSRIPQCARPGTGIAPAPVVNCRLQTVRPRRICCPSTAPCLAKPGTGIAPAPVADCRLCHPGPCRPGTASSHRLPAPSGTASSYRLPTPPGTIRPPANPNPTCKQRNAAPTEMVDAASTLKGE